MSVLVGNPKDKFCGAVAHEYKHVVYFRYLGIGLAAQGVSMNRLPGESLTKYSRLNYTFE